ncbi:MAG: putative lipid II flippase FtsW [Kiritimatiellae bacterium]|nr:putative lipid II flippase FtsW [Kiritimatiellia bacterium]
MRRVAATLVLLVVALAALGLVMLASSSSVLSENLFSNFFQRQLVWMFLAALVCIGSARLDYRWLRFWAPYVMGAVAILLVLTRVPGIGREVNGSWRWIGIGPVNIQSSELAKFALVLYLASALYRMESEPAWGMRQSLWRVGLPSAMILGLVFIGPDFGTTMLLAAVAGAIMFIAGIRLRYLLMWGVAGGVGLTLAMLQDEVRMTRIKAFLDPVKHAEKEAYQLLNALYAFVAGGARGAGLGGSLQKHFFLPECHTDFILPIIGEELGITASLGVWLMFVCFSVCGVIIAWKASDNFGRLLALGITLVLSVQAAINIAVVTGCMPTKGLALPFISYGGSSLIVSGLMIGVLISVARIASSHETPRARARDRIRSM